MQRLSLHSLWLVLWLANSFAFADDFRVTDLLGRTKVATVSAIDEKGVHLRVGDKSGVRTLSELRSIHRIAATEENQVAKSEVEIMLVGGGRLFGNTVTMDEENCVVMGNVLSSEPIAVPLDFVRAVILAQKQVTSEMRTELMKPREEDRFLVRIEDTIESLDGLVEGLSETELSFTWNDNSRKLNAKDVLAIGIADAGAEFPGAVMVRLLDGQVLRADMLNLKGDRLAVKLFGDAPLEVPWQQVAAVEVRSDRLRYLSDFDPAIAVHKPIVTTKRSWRRDLNVNGDPLQLGERSYSKGVGVASWSLLKYSVGGEYSTFCATIGLDSSTEGRGDCVFVVRADGKELMREEMKGTDAAKPIQVEIENSQDLELIVLPGKDLDLSDHANWCDACVLK